MIPAYNQARFLGAAIQSVMTADDRGTEIIVVDDGSSDDTAAVIAAFGARVRTIRQSNQGLAAARNAGIRAASGHYIALLDADDEWMPNFLSTMRRLIVETPGAGAYFGVAKLIDVDGQGLPQLPGPFGVKSEDMLATLLRTNFLVPSTMVLDRSAVLDAGMFRDGFRGVEDRDLWLRMLKRDALFVGTDRCVAYYRIHSDSLSADPTTMQRSAKLVIEDLYGLDDGLPQSWPADKRRVWAGHYRYCALTSIVRAGDWKACGEHLARAFVTDPTLIADADLFYELALGLQPLGWRGTRERLDLRANAQALAGVLEDVFSPPIDDRLATLEASVHHAVYRALAQVAWLVGERRLSRKHLRAAAQYGGPESLRAGWWRDYLRTYVPEALLVVRRARADRAISAQ